MRPAEMLPPGDLKPYADIERVTMGILIPIVFPEYKITVEVPKTEVDLLPWVQWDNVRIPMYKNRHSNLGHAGALFINTSSGATKYYEYGRYDAQGIGLVRRVPIPNVKVNKDSIDFASLKVPLRQISKIAGQYSKIEGAYIEAQGKFGAMLDYSEHRKGQNANPKRAPYSILSNSCIHFVKGLATVAGVATPWMVDPRPNSYIGEFRDEFSDLNYDPKIDTLTIEGVGQF